MTYYIACIHSEKFVGMAFGHSRDYIASETEKETRYAENKKAEKQKEKSRREKKNNSITFVFPNA